MPEPQSVRNDQITPPPAADVDTDEDSDGRKGKSGKSSYKIQIQLSSKQRNKLFELRDLTEVESATQVVREALKVYEYIVKNVVVGDNKLFFENEKTGETIEVLV